MSWTTRKRLLLILLGALILALSVVVFALNQNASTDVLAVIGVAGGAATIVNALPENGDDDG